MQIKFDLLQISVSSFNLFCGPFLSEWLHSSARYSCKYLGCIPKFPYGRLAHFLRLDGLLLPFPLYSGNYDGCSRRILMLERICCVFLTRGFCVLPYLFFPLAESLIASELIPCLFKVTGIY